MCPTERQRRRGERHRPLMKGRRWWRSLRRWLPSPARAKPSAPLWRAPEPVLFTCDLGNKTVSICSEEQGGAVAVRQVGPQSDLSDAAYDRKLINQLYAVRNAYVDRHGQPDLKRRYAAEQRDALRELEGEKPWRIEG